MLLRRKRVARGAVFRITVIHRTCNLRRVIANNILPAVDTGGSIRFRSQRPGNSRIAYARHSASTSLADKRRRGRFRFPNASGLRALTRLKADRRAVDGVQRVAHILAPSTAVKICRIRSVNAVALQSVYLSMII